MSALAIARQKAAHLNLALQHICFNLQLPENLFNSARDKYLEVGNWLTKVGSPVRAYLPRIFHQGSMLLDTTNRPFSRMEYDLDAVCLFQVKSELKPRQVFDLVWKHMSQNPDYKDIIRPKPRCIRVDFPGKFHLDIVPAVPDGAISETSLYIPDLPTEAGKWKASDPEGFAKWFEVMCMKMRVRKFSALAESSVDPIPDRQPYNRKRPLKRAVQLIKRWRDKRFHGIEELSTPSIVVTRLAGDAYDGEDDLFDAVGRILDEWHALFAKGKPVVRNPVNLKEVISEKWEEKPESFAAFKLGIADFRNRWQALPELTGIHNIARELGDLFGDPAAQAVKESFAPTETARKETSLHVSRDTRTLLTAPAPAAIKVQSHTFHGN
jgi:Second Messenger Oligonucleotide or Dinucleotide Synthetase domain